MSVIISGRPMGRTPINLVRGLIIIGLIKDQIWSLLSVDLGVCEMIKDSKERWSYVKHYGRLRDWSL